MEDVNKAAESNEEESSNVKENGPPQEEVVQKNKQMTVGTPGDSDAARTTILKPVGEGKNGNKTASKQRPERKGCCYCGKERNLNIVELLCASCLHWYHESCIGLQLGKLVPFMMNYVFVCKNCSPTGLESFKKNQAAFTQMCVTALGNLKHASAKEGTPRTMFSKDKEIVPFIDLHWEGMTTMPRRVTQSWHSTIHRALMKDTGTLFVCDDTGKTDAHPLYGLQGLELVDIRPNYEAMIRGGHLKITDMGVQHVQPSSTVKGRSTKRKIASDQGGGGRQRGRVTEATAPKLSAHGYPLEHPFNKDGYRYFLAEPDPHAPFRQEFDESPDWAGRPIPGWLYRRLCPSTVLLALHDRAPQLHISEDRLSVTGEKGYSMVRATHSVSRGTWYWEATVEEMPDGSATRLGWGQEYGNLQAPLGYDKFGYSWRSRKGTRFHECRGKHYSPAYGEGDVLGFMIVLPDSNEVNHLPQPYKDRPLVKFKSHLYYEEKDTVNEKLKQLKIIPGSKLIFYKNGVSQGVAFTDIYGGSYYPSLSLHKSSTVSVNFGPNFKFPPTDFPFRPISEKAEEAICEQALADILYLTENEGRLRLDIYGS
ncbi:set1/Ash2 histone methyltransferase complex subunit ASH2-like [Schistocerca nitens]|uniref:set1/Ash2 histone methyltransferase complex subunit ASH2-like n=1 Tax=Schistocerca nitens TaxID=7011 RepID=UPI002117B4F6|nr:set1/Ash2 histone methyltransferase complex subunit ASH2-like [Schistocerca nitens]